MPFNANSTIKEVMEDDRAKVIIETHLPGASNHPLLAQAWYMTLREVSFYPESGMTAERYQRILEELAELDD